MSKWQQVGQELAQKLKGLTDEETIKELAQSIVTEIRESYPDSINSRKKPMADIRKVLRGVYPATETQEHQGQYFTESGKGNVPRWEHLFFKHFTLSTEEYDSVGDEARSQWRSTQNIESEVKETTLTQTLKTMNISQLELDADTQKIVEDAIAHSGVSLAEFVQKACQVYAKTVMGKVKQGDEDLSAVSTNDLMSETYKTHPGRAEELTRRAIYALEIYNNQFGVESDKDKKWHINQTAIQTLTGSKAATIQKILQKYQTRLTDHNAKHGLSPYDNRKPGLKIDAVIKLSELVPNGIDIN
ncbi:hypothetical protein [Nostoc sp. FACHB-190]|uniref:hypothetical protein n=1 Tax=Nostoc sp. FACHB-190 TaxID=2692838 RepID=UPI00168A2FA0|nr:hypothetical protein [Nostoc sp. FACHB-190]MBD2303601.1 hypothetical protein [Nostoc sp. FACHB-190]